MKQKTRQILWALFVGLTLTAGLTAIAYFLHEADIGWASEIVFWQNTILQSFVPLHNVGTPDRPLYFGTALNYLAFLASFPVGVIVYSLLTYIFLSWRANKTT